MVGRFSRNPQIAWFLVLAAILVATLMAYLPQVADPQGAAVALALSLAAAVVAVGLVAARTGYRAPAVVPVQARRRTQAPPAWTVTRVPRTPRRPRAPGGR